MQELHRSANRGHTNCGWRDSRHSFTFADHYDTRNMDFGPVRVINESRIQGRAGFDIRLQHDMEIISYVLDGALSHTDSIGEGGVVAPGDVRRMSAGRGALHSEYSDLDEGDTHFLQIWIEPNVRGIPASREQKCFATSEKRGRLRLILSPDGRDGSVLVHQDVLVYAGLFDGGERFCLALGAGRHAYLHVARGTITANGTRMEAGDGLKLSEEQAVELDRGNHAEVLLFDVNGWRSRAFPIARYR